MSKPVDDLALLKKQLTRKNASIKKRNTLDENREDGTKRTIFEVDFETIRTSIDADLLEQISPLVKEVEDNYMKYKEHVVNLEKADKYPLSSDPRIFYANKVSEVQVGLLYNQGILNEADREVLRSDGFIWELQPVKDQQTVKFTESLASLGHLNLSTMATTVRKLTVSSLVLQSPYLRFELDDLFHKWVETFKDVIKTKFCKVTRTPFDEEPEDEEDDEESPKAEEEMDDDSGDIMDKAEKNYKSKSESEPNQQEEGDEEANIDDIFNNLTYSQNIKLGGTLKQLLGLWNSEEIFESCIYIFYWLVGYLRIRETEKAYIFECKELAFDSDFTENQFIKLCSSNPKRKSFIGKEAAASIAKIIWRWIQKQKELEDQLSNPAKFNLDDKKIKGYKAQRLLKVRLSPEELFSRLNEAPIMQELVEISNEYPDVVCEVEKKAVLALLTAENNFFCNHLRHKQTSYYNGKENYTMISEQELSCEDVEYWFLANLLWKNYVPLLPVCNNFCKSLFDMAVDAQLKGRYSNTPDAIFKKKMIEIEIDELVSEFETFLSIVHMKSPNSYQKLKAQFLREEFEDFKKLTLQEVCSSLLKPDSTESISANSLDNDSEFKNKLRSVFTALHNNVYEDNDKIGPLVGLIRNEYWLEFTQKIDASDLVHKSIKANLSVLLKELEEARVRQNVPNIIKDRILFDALHEEIPLFVTIHKDCYKERALTSKEVFEFYEKLTKEIGKLLDVVICNANARKSADELYSNIREVFAKFTISKENDPVDANYIFTIDKNGKVTNNLPKEQKDHWKKLRRLVPEFRAPKEDSLIGKEIWKKLSPFIRDSYWKVQIGLVTWYALMVEGSAYEAAVLQILSRAEFGKARTKDAATKVMGQISEHFKLHADPTYKTVNPELLEVPWFVFSGADTIFGFTDAVEIECKNWKKDVLENILNWVGEYPPENFATLDLNYDFEISMEHFLRDFKRTYSPYNLQFSERCDKLVAIPSERLKKFKPQKEIRTKLRDSNYHARNDEEGIVVLQDFFTWCKSFLKYSVDGSAQGLKIDVEKLYLNISEDQLEEKKETEDDITAAQTTTIFSRNVEIEEPEPEISEKSSSTEITEKAIEKTIKRNRAAARDEDNYTRDKTLGKNKSLTKTLAFALGGKNLARLLFWVGGPTYCPELNIHLKIEKKKIRLVANSDIVTFNKQNYLYEWFSKGLPDNTKELIYTYIHPRDKVRRVERFQQCFTNEKWLCPMDLKDFQNQFGPIHHRTLMRCFYRRMNTITDPQIRKEMEYIITTLYDELCKGVIFFRKSKTEDFRPVKDALPERLKKYIRSFECKPPKVFEDPLQEEETDPDMSEGNIVVDEDGNVEIKDTINEPTKYNLFSAFEVKNGLLSGWKLTSAFGSIYNYSTNNLVNFWSLYHFGIVPTDFATQGDDTHFKTRYLINSLFHTAFVNSIGKEAHPKKQFFSTRYTEFLKKTYDVWKKDTRYQPCRMISSILFENENRESKANNRNNLKDCVDLWNQFLVRIPDTERREYITGQMKYPHKALRVRFKWYDDRHGHNKYSLEDIDKMLSTPEKINSFLSGPLTRKELLCVEVENGNFKLYTQYLQTNMRDYLIEFQHGLNVAKWDGIRTYSQSVIRQLGANKKVNLIMDVAFRTEIQKKIFEAVGESLTEYTKPSVLGTIDTYKLHEKTEYWMDLIRRHVPTIYEEIESNIVDYLEGKDLTTPYAQLMLLNNQFTKSIEQVLRNPHQGVPLKNYEIFEVLSRFNSRCRLTQNLFRKMCERMDPKIVFEFALNGDLGVSITRNVVHDELMGAIALITSETLPLLIYQLFSFKDLMWSEEDQRDFISTMILWMEVDIFRHKHKDFVKLLRDTSLRKLYSQPF